MEQGSTLAEEPSEMDRLGAVLEADGAPPAAGQPDWLSSRFGTPTVNVTTCGSCFATTTH